uniref:Uncharacterized protein n=1 Tax=Arundo donax TaxID=35708 RepID=A0A0A9GPL8_ARUDO
MKLVYAPIVEVMFELPDILLIISPNGNRPANYIWGLQLEATYLTMNVTE